MNSCERENILNMLGYIPLIELDDETLICGEDTLEFNGIIAIDKNNDIITIGGSPKLIGEYTIDYTLLVGNSLIGDNKLPKINVFGFSKRPEIKDIYFDNIKRINYHLTFNFEMLGDTHQQLMKNFLERRHGNYGERL